CSSDLAVVVEPSGLDLLPALAGAADRDALQLRQLKLTGVRVNGTAIELPTFETQLTFGRNGAVQKFRLSDGKITIDATPKDKGLALVIDAREWALPIGPALEFSDLSITAQVDRQQATFSAINGRVASGRLKGALQASWSGNVKVEGEFTLENAQLQQLLPAFTREFLALGSATMNGSFALQGKTLKTLFETSETEATFTVNVGEMNNVDLVRAIQSPVPGGTRGGKTKFDTLAGAISAANGRISFKQLQLASGPLNASGAINVGNDGALSGRISAELGSRGLVVARGSLNVTGAVRDPLLRP
ncbi:MAG: AsmA-like C-terminal region-containing protein, partial [Burkholderiales bacterium]